MDIINGILAFIGSAGVIAGFIWIMIAKQGWKLAQISAGFILAMVVAVNVPKLPTAVNDGIVNIINAIVKS